MIHIFEYKNCWFDRNPDILLQYVSMPIIFEKFLSKNKIINNFVTNNKVVHNEIYEGQSLITKNYIEEYLNNNDCEILFFNIESVENYLQNGNGFVDWLSKKYTDKKFIVLTGETFFTFNEQSFKNKNVFYIINSINAPYKFISNASMLQNCSNYYIMNLYLQENYNKFINSLYHQTRDLVRTKKYNFFNGIHKPHRLKCYEIIKNNDMLDEGYFSYVDFAHFKNDESQYDDFKNFIGFVNTDSYISYLNQFEIPYFCDTNEVNPNVFVAFAIPPQYSLQSYVSITTETYFFEGMNSDNVNFSEKSLKAFYGFNIPLILGHYTTIRYLKDLGFDMFEDLFDLTPQTNRNKIFEQFDKNVKVIKNMSKNDLHNYFVKNLNRIHNNFTTLTNRMFEYDLYNFNNFINIPNEKL